MLKDLVQLDLVDLNSGIVKKTKIVKLPTEVSDFLDCGFEEEDIIILVRNEIMKLSKRIDSKQQHIVLLVKSYLNNEITIGEFQNQCEETKSENLKWIEHK